MRTLRMAGVAAVVSALALTATGPANAGVIPAPDTSNQCRGGAKIEPVADGTYYRYLNGVRIRITLNVNETAKTFSFTTSRLVTTVVVKGGPVAPMVYTYPSGTTSGSGLHAPVNVNSGRYYGLSHVCFFSSKGKKGGTDL